MKYTVEHNDKYSVFKLSEEKLDATISPELKSIFIKLLNQGEKNIIFDASEIKYTDSSGLSAILTGYKLCRDNKGIFILAGLNDHVYKLIEISQLHKVFDILPTVHEAAESIFMSEIENELKSGKEE